MNVLCVAELRLCVEFGKQRAAHADRHHLSDRVQAGTGIVVNDSRAGRLRQSLNALEQLVSASKRQQTLAFQLLNGECWLRDMALLRGLSEMTTFSKRDDIFELAKTGAKRHAQ